MSGCEPSFSDRLLFYVEGELSEEEREELSIHISSCESCRKETENLRKLLDTVRNTARYVKENTKHPSPEEMATFSMTPDELPGEKIRRIKEHLLVCPLCRKEFELLSESPRIDDEFGEESVLEFPGEKIMPPDLIFAYRAAYSGKRSTQNDSLDYPLPKRKTRRRFPAPALASVVVIVAAFIFVAVLSGDFRSEDIKTNNLAKSSKHQFLRKKAFSNDEIAGRKRQEFLEKISDVIVRYNDSTGKMLTIGLLEVESLGHIKGGTDVCSVNVCIFKRQPVSPEDEDMIKQKIRKKIEWNKNWDGDIVFVMK